MTLDIQFSETNQSFDCSFGEINNISDGGYENGYDEGYSKGEEAGYSDGYSKGKADGLAQRQYETWTFILEDGTEIEKEVALI